MTLQETVQTIEAVRSAIESGGGMAELAKLSDAAGVPPKQVFSKAFEEKHRVQISTVCQQYAMTGEWPVLTPAQQLLVCERLQAAASFLWILQNAAVIHGRSPLLIDPTADRSKVLVFLLVDYWGLSYAEQWALKYP